MDSRLRTPKVIFECYVEYTRPKESEDPQLKFCYPKDYEFDEDTKKNLSKFVFPNGDCNTSSEEHFTFVLTDLDGVFRFGFCRYPAKGDTCSCFLSGLPWFKVFYRAMDKIADLRLDFQNEVVEPFLAGLRNHSMPTLGMQSVISIVPEEVDSGQVYTFPLPNPKRLPEIPTDHNLTLFYPNLHHQVILCLFANLIFERRIIVTSSSLTLLSASMHATILLLYPLFWQHIFIPITPLHLIDYCAAPMPFLIGVHSSMMERVRSMPINDVVILDVDNNEIESPYYEDLLQLPPDVVSQLKHVLKKSSSAYGDTVTKGFLMAMVAMLGGYRSALKMREGDAEVTFDEDMFLKSRVHMEEFLSELLHFQHFRQFMNSRINRLTERLERDLFDEAVITYEDDFRTNKFSAEQMKQAFADVKDISNKLGNILQKHGAKAVKNTRTFMKDTKRHWQGKASEKISPVDGNFLTMPPIHGLTGVERKSATIDGRLSGSPVQQNKVRKPPQVVPYNRHIAGKKKLQQSLDAMYHEKRLSNPDVQVGHLLSFTPPEERSENASLSSKDSVEVTSSEVLTGNLVDIGPYQDPYQTQELNTFESSQTVVLDEGDTESDSIISSSSGTGSPTLESPWPSSPPPPIPPPRKKRMETQAEASRDVPTNDPFVPLSAVNNSLMSFQTARQDRASPLDDFTSSIAELLINTDPNVASALSTANHDSYQANSQSKVYPLPPNVMTLASTSSSTPNFSTAMPLGDLTQRTSSSTHLASSAANDPWKPISPSRTAVANKPRVPPARPKPYSGAGTKSFDPLGDIFGAGGMHGYLKSTGNSNFTQKNSSEKS